MARSANETVPVRARTGPQQSRTSRASWVPMKDQAVESIQKPTADIVALPNRRTGPTSVPPSTPFTPTFNADRPFLLMIRHNETGSILFLGRMMDPTHAK